MEKWSALAPLALAAAALLAPVAEAQVPLRGTSQAARLTPADGLDVHTAARLRTRGAGLRITLAEPGRVELRAADCHVTLTDRNADGRYEGKQVRAHGSPSATCPPSERPFTPSEVEAGPDIPALDRCRLHTTTPEWSVACQPTRFGRDTGEPWTVLSGFRTRWSAIGRPDSLAWNAAAPGGLLVWDDHSGALYRIIQTPPAPPAPTDALPDPEPRPPRTLRPTGSRLYTLTKSPERTLADTQRAESLGRAWEEFQGVSEPPVLEPLVSSNGE